MEIQHEPITDDFLDFLNKNLHIKSEINNQKRLNSQLLAEQKFKNTPNDNFNLQYNNIYMNRFNQLKSRFKTKEFKQISSLENEGIIRGIIKKNYVKKQSVVTRFMSSEHTQQYLETICSLQDQVQIEDDTGKIKIMFTDKTKFKFDYTTSIQKNQYKITDIPFGVVVTIKGTLNKKLNKFMCESIFFPNFLPQKLKLPNISDKQRSIFQIIQKMNKDDQFILLTSALTLQSSNNSYIKLKEFLYGSFCPQEVKKILQKISTLVICGNLSSKKNQTRGLSRDEYLDIDQHLLQISTSINVYLMLNKNDSLSQMWIKEPINPILLPQSAHKITRCSNPEKFSIKGINLIGTTGENIVELKRITSLANQEIQLLETHILCNHIAPNAPSTMKIPPFNNDPFVLDELPHIYFSGGCKEYNSKLITSGGSYCRLICVPKFEEGFVLVNIRTLQTHKIKV